MIHSLCVSLLVFLLGLLPVGTASQTPGSEQDAPLMVEGAEATGLVVDPTTDVARYALVRNELYTHGTDGEWKLSGTVPYVSTVIVDSTDTDVLWAGVGEECYRGGGQPIPMQRTRDGGEIWTEIGAPALVPLASWSNEGVVVAHDCAGLQISVDHGTSWTFAEGLPRGSQVTAFAAGPGPSDDGGTTLWAGVTGEGGTSELYRIAVSDSGAIDVSEPLRTYYGIGSLEVTESGAVLLGAPQGVLRSDDDGASWIVDRDGLESTTLERDPIDAFPTDLEPGSFGLNALIDIGSDLYVGGVDGVYHLGNLDKEWTLILPLEKPAVHLASNADASLLYVQTDDGRVFKTSLQ